MFSNFLFLDFNITSSDLLVFKGNLLALIHSTTSFRSMFMYLFLFLSDFSMRSNLVSSEKWCSAKLNYFMKVVYESTLGKLGVLELIPVEHHISFFFYLIVSNWY